MIKALPILHRLAVQPLLVHRNFHAEDVLIQSGQWEIGEVLNAQGRLGSQFHVRFLFFNKVQPPEAREKHKGPLIVGKVVERVGRRNLWDDAFERFRVLDCRSPLDVAKVAAANHSDVTVAPVLLGKPVDRIRTVLPLVDERIELTPAVFPAPDVLHHVNVATLYVHVCT